MSLFRLTHDFTQRKSEGEKKLSNKCDRIKVAFRLLNNNSSIKLLFNICLNLKSCRVLLMC